MPATITKRRKKIRKIDMIGDVSSFIGHMYKKLSNSPKFLQKLVSRTYKVRKRKHKR